MKKAQIEVSFNWIFVLLAGFGILMFFYMIINAQTEQSQEQLSRTITQRMGSIFESIQSSPNVAQEHQRISFELDFTCTNGVHEFRRGGASTSAYLENSVIFTPSTVGDSPLFTLTQRLSLPYIVTPVLFLSDEKTHYRFNDLPVIYNSLDNIFSKSQGDIEGEFNPSQYRQVIYVKDKNSIVSDEYGNLPSNVKIIKVDTNNQKVFFENNQNLTYFSNEMLLGAIITGNYDLAKCNFDKINQTYNRITELVKIRMSKINDTLDLGNCRNIYNSLDINLNFDMSPTHFNANRSLIENRNQDLRTLGCPTIY